MSDLSAIKWNAQGLVPAIVQDSVTRQVLMLAWMNAESLGQTLETGETVFWSRSRQELWHKGASSGNTQRVRAVHLDCDADCLLVEVQPAGPACHTGEVTCFFRTLKTAFPESGAME
ncbi:MAG: phosphoribosyl-AMP cyclohydrolase [Anaerolineaceae bacterium]|nr:phosphoribosyl-AMP cyclohydrolase [Anaerolineaceae bacterium]MDE0329871.1 phosphoribosyl-AMP cyclohydrolase [Anaerolineaceae bacterium]